MKYRSKHDIKFAVTVIIALWDSMQPISLWKAVSVLVEWNRCCIQTTLVLRHLDV